jgi:DNA processing protein
VVVVEARRRSGSLITARHAADQGVDVFAVPGPITAPTSQGPNRLIQEGAIPLLTPEDLLEPLARLLPLPSTAVGSRGSEATGEVTQRRAAADSTITRSILAVLQDTPMTRDQLALRLDLPLSALALDLIRLELDGRVVEERNGRLRPVASLGGSRL